MIMALPFLLAVAATGRGECHGIDKEFVLARDVAAFVPAFAAVPGEFNLGYIPLSGTQRILRGADLQRVAKNRGFDLDGLPDICFERRTFVPTADQIREAMRVALGVADAKIEVSSSSQHPAPVGEVVFPREALQVAESQRDALWRGYVRYGDDQHFGLWAKVRITANVTRVVTTANIAAGKPIRANQVRLESCEDSLLDETMARSLDEVVGYLSRTPLRTATLIRKSQLERPPDVARGDLVTVNVFEGGAHLSLEGRAEQGGFKGATIVVRNTSSGKDFRAQVTGKDQVTVGQTQ